MNPLFTPTPKSSDNDLGQGTRATSGGSKVVSGGRTALGGIAPLSPFLPLPAAPSAEELKRQCSQDGGVSRVGDCLLNIVDDTSTTRRASNSGVQDEPKAKKSRSPSNAAHMVRSYSMPVATQVDYEAHRQAILQRHPFMPSFHANTSWEKGWPDCTPQIKVGPNAMTSSLSSIGMTNSKENQQQQQSRRPSYQRSTKSSPKVQPRSPLSIVTINEVCTQNEQNPDADLGSGSDEADVVTPRAISPRESYFGHSSKEPMIPMFENFEDFVHPDHLRAPPHLSL